jgi:hypothetical protein
MATNSEWRVKFDELSARSPLAEGWAREGIDGLGAIDD